MHFNMVREAGLEPAWPLQPGDFKSPEYTYFSTLANLLRKNVLAWRLPRHAFQHPQPGLGPAHPLRCFYCATNLVERVGFSPTSPFWYPLIIRMIFGIYAPCSMLLILVKHTGIEPV